MENSTSYPNIRKLSHCPLCGGFKTIGTLYCYFCFEDYCTQSKLTENEITRTKLDDIERSLAKGES